VQAPNCIVFDIDGTLANVDHRRSFVATKPKNWKAWNAGLVRDTPHAHIVYLNRIIAASGEFKIIVCSGRGEEVRPQTEAWLKHHDVNFEKLYMRREKDFRKDFIVKEELLDQMIRDGYVPYIVFDDRESVVQMWRRRGIPCLQVAKGDF
jgi:hypothetical protein